MAARQPVDPDTDPDPDSDWDEDKPQQRGEGIRFATDYFYALLIAVFDYL